jgi:hypothetical protein
MWTLPLPYTVERFPDGTHLCFIYNDDEERREEMARFVESGGLIVA